MNENQASKERHIKTVQPITYRIEYSDFERRVKQYLENMYQTEFHEQSLPVGFNKNHKFDLVSEDKQIVAECKSYTWTKSNNFPSAKVSTAIEALFYLSRINVKKKIVIFQDHRNNRGESLVEIFTRRYDGIIDDVEVWAYNVKDTVKNDRVTIIRPPKENWYKTFSRII